ncbi:hypothetical protein D3C78_1910800 [compost metagenome]
MEKYEFAGENTPMYSNGQSLIHDFHFQDHFEAGIPVQVYYQNMHKDIGFVEYYSLHFVKVNNILYNRHLYTFISRPGY